MFRLDGIKLTFEEAALDFVVDKAMEFKLGARGLRSIMESIMTTAMFNAPSSKKKNYVITLEYAQKEFDQNYRN